MKNPKYIPGLKTKATKRNKYGNTHFTAPDGEKFKSIKEYHYLQQLKMLQVAKDDSNRVDDWEREVKYSLDVNKVHIANYFLDYKVTYADGHIEYVDVKGIDKKTGKHITSTDVYKLKKKLMLAIHGIEIIER